MEICLPFLNIEINKKFFIDSSHNDEQNRLLLAKTVASTDQVISKHLKVFKQTSSRYSFSKTTKT